MKHTAVDLRHRGRLGDDNAGVDRSQSLKMNFRKLAQFEKLFFVGASLNQTGLEL
jgi:hypothetical protein